MVIWTISFPWPCLVSPLASGSPVNSTLTWENWPSTWCPSPGCTSSCPDSPPWPPVAASNTDPWLSPSWPNKCLMPRTWWPLAILAMADTWLSLLCSEAVCPWRKLMNKCWTSKIRTALTLLSGSPTMSRLLSVTFLLVVLRWLLLSSVSWNFSTLQDLQYWNIDNFWQNCIW